MDVTAVMFWGFLTILVMGIVYWICIYGCKSEKQTVDEEQGDVVVNREENYESIFVNPPQQEIIHQPTPSYTPISLRGSHASRGSGSRDTELPPYKPIGTPPPSYDRGRKMYHPDSTYPVA